MRRLSLTLAALIAVTTLLTAAAPPAGDMYAAALARENMIRPSLTAADSSPKILVEVRSIVHAYELVVWHHPTNGFSDNALWQAGRLSLDAFARFGQTVDKESGIKLLRRLADAYPTSKFVKQVAEQVARAESASADAAAVAPPAVEPPAPTRSPVPSDKQDAVATIRDIRREVLEGAVRVTIELDAEVSFRDERISDPMRVFIDLTGTRAVAALQDRTLRFEGDADVVRQVRTGRHPNNVVRVVLDAAGVSAYSVYPLYDPYRIVIDCVRGTPSRAGPEAVAPPLRARRVGPALARQAPSVGTHGADWIVDAREALDRPAALPEPAPAPPKMPDAVPIAPLTPIVPPVKTVTGGFSMARQLGLNVSRIVIDPGHGGHDPGAKGKGVTEAELVLDIALRVEKLLQKVNGVEVILTRRSDEFITLQERTAIANREGADLFLSIHANASPNAQAGGVETYFLNFANNLSAAAVAARENAASGQAMAALPDFVKMIALHNKLDESREFARYVQKSMVDRIRPANKAVRDLGVKQAPFVVLIGAAMPSVLAEVSFVTNPQEARLLKGNSYRQRIADALFSAIQSYQKALKGVTSVAVKP